jgi:hypothetical protein
VKSKITLELKILCSKIFWLLCIILNS